MKPNGAGTSFLHALHQLLPMSSTMGGGQRKRFSTP
jgi:hypothetical protein